MLSHADLACNCTPEEVWNRINALADMLLNKPNPNPRIYKALTWHIEHYLFRYTVSA